jgi:hypothetical protein
LFDHLKENSVPGSEFDLLVFVHDDPVEVLVLLYWLKLQAVLREVIQFRQKKADIFSPNSHRSAGINEYLPWTAAPGKGGLREALLLQVYQMFCV